ncbi:unnamed protein product [Bursaphelenchus xylophilus]|uniref:(pine wood nematode) hypothetical protein n=1 Tax=Bursaphelenchus xylophilus TaxID=6326 RepID=A0A1I7S0Q4_BURXY|nr:unnamed protein product [Bursaphelenchus xylophilus]CAG9088251.1 unnamed protein product [Bursaphelenchus xylophilus]
MPPPSGIHVMKSASNHLSPKKHPWHAFSKDGEDEFRFEKIHILRHGWGYGGNTAAISLYAAFQTVPADMMCASFQSQFIRPVDKPTVKVFVERCRESSAEVHRLVKLYCDGKLAYRMDCRFCKKHLNFTNIPQTPHKFPNVTPPESCQTSYEILKDYQSSGGDLSAVRNVTFADDQPQIDHRLTNGVNGITGYDEKKYSHTIWSRYKLENHDMDRNFEELVLTNLSDLGMCYASCLMFPKQSFNRVASLSLSVWFHCANFNANDFVLQKHDVIGHNHNRSLTSGQMWSRDGRLLATAIQEAIIEVNEDKKAKY